MYNIKFMNLFLLLYVILLFLCDSYDEIQQSGKLEYESHVFNVSNIAKLQTVLFQNKIEKKKKTLIISLPSVPPQCKLKTECSNLSADCIECEFNTSCVYGESLNVTCKPLNDIECNGNQIHQRNMLCRFCYQTDHLEHICQGRANCNSATYPLQYYRTNCSVLPHIVCMGHRTFLKKLPCNWTNGFGYWKALILSIVGGGFGADRFYLGYWQEGIGKLFSFGGLGVWTLLDIILIALEYLKPADGSVYI